MFILPGGFVARTLVNTKCLLSEVDLKKKVQEKNTFKPTDCKTFCYNVLVYFLSLFYSLLVECSGKVQKYSAVVSMILSTHFQED